MGNVYTQCYHLLECVKPYKRFARHECKCCNLMQTGFFNL